MFKQGAILLALFIFFARVMDVSLGTIRVISISRGKKYLSAAIGFLEVLIWIFAMGQILQHLDNVLSYLAFAGGFAVGNFAGIFIIEKLSLGVILIRVITIKDAGILVSKLRSAGYSITTSDGEGATGPVKIIFTILPRKRAAKYIQIVKEHNPQAFYSIEEVSYVNARPEFTGNFAGNKFHWLNAFRPARKSK